MAKNKDINISPSKVSEAAAVKARWLGNFCPRQPAHRVLKRQRSPGTVAYARAGPDGSRMTSRLGQS